MIWDEGVGLSLLLHLVVVSFMLYFAVCFRVQQWASVFSSQLRDLTTKYSGSLLLQKVNDVCAAAAGQRGNEGWCLHGSSRETWIRPWRRGPVQNNHFLVLK